jgi:uncharacterized repeat protein (TIGR03943 family)
MRPWTKTIHQWLNPALLGLWTLFLGYLLLSSEYTGFLRPEFGLLLGFAHFIAMGFMIAGMTRTRAGEVGFPVLLRALVLLTPILYFAVMPAGGTLGAHAFGKRFTGVETAGVQRDPGVRQDPEAGSGLPSDPGEIVPARQGRLRERTILDLLLHPESYQGKRVTVTGMILRDGGLKRHFGEMDTVLYQFRISCCAADAQPVAMVLEMDPATETPARDQWFRVEGLFGTRVLGGKPVPVLGDTVIRPIETPSSPYLF